MPACVESLAYVSNEENGRFVPWHGLGTPVAEAMTSAEAIELAGLDWEVNQEDVLTEKGVKIPGYYANVRSSDGKVLGIVGNRYKIVQNKEAFEFTDSLINGEVKYETAGSLCGGRRIFLLAKLPQYEILGDAVDPFIVFTNSHDGTGAIKVACTPTRVVCSNTLNLALKDAKRSWSTRHMGDMQSKLDEAKRALELADEYIVCLGKEAEMLANVTINFDMINAALDKCFPVAENDTDRKKNRIEGIKNTFIQCYDMEDIEKFKGTAWGAVNAMADMVSHPNPGRRTASFQENNWGKIIDGQTVLDDFTTNLLTTAGVKVA